jgi:hypothetical protein
MPAVAVPVKRPNDPLEAAKSGSLATATPVTDPELEPIETPPSAPPVPVAAKHPPPAPRERPAPPAPPVYEVLEDKVVAVNRGMTTMRKGKLISRDSHDLEALRAQGVKFGLVTGPKGSHGPL